MILLRQRLYSHTYENITDAAKRKAKAEELLRKRKEFQAGFDLKKRIEQINEKYLEDLKKTAEGNPIGGKEPRYVSAKELQGRRNNAIENAKAYWNDAYENMTEGVSRKKMSEEATRARKVAKEAADREAATLKGRLKKAKKNIGEFAKKNKKGLVIGGSIAAASGLAYGGAKIYKKHQDKKKSEDIRRKVHGYDTDTKKK